MRRKLTTISTTSTTARELPSSHAFQAASLCAERSGAARATTIGAAIVRMEVRANTTVAIPASRVLTFALRI
jgi:hypothetical protein